MAGLRMEENTASARFFSSSRIAFALSSTALT